MTRKGLTLVELMVVLAIVALLLPVGAWGVAQRRQAEQWRAAAGALEGLLRAGGQIARSSGREVRLAVAGGAAYLEQDGLPLHLGDRPLAGGRTAAPHLRVELLPGMSLSPGGGLRWRASGRVEGPRELTLAWGGRSRTYAVSGWGEVR